MKWLIPISLAALGGTARADQCAWIDDAVAQRAQAVLARAPKVLAFCEPCGDPVPGVPAVAQKVAVTEPSPGFAEVSINGAAVDLAYTYVQTSATEYKNLAALAGCAATGVSPSLEVAPETTHGVLIAADTKPVGPAVVALPAPVPTAVPMTASAPAPAPAPPQVYVHSSTTRYELAWPALVLAAGTGAALGSLLTALAIATRRRREMRPRASELR